MDIPVMEMIARSGWVARIILAVLALFSILTWAIIFNRLHYFGQLRKAHRLFRKRYGDARGIKDMDGGDGTKGLMARLGKTGSAEYNRIIADSRSHTSVKDWSFFLQNQFTMASQRLESELTAAGARLDSGLILLAIISSVAPFLGLLGTVWGIMNSFFEIGHQGSASLPVVAPGIAEALITTIVGLGVAIPAVFFYNFFMHGVGRVEDELEEIKDLILLRLKREILTLLYGNKTPGPAR